MSQENVEVVRAAIDAANRGDWEAVFAHAVRDFEWESDARLPNAGVYRGRAEIQQFFEDQAAPFDRTVIESEDLLVNGDYVVALVRIRRRPKGSDAEVVVNVGHLWTFRNGRAVRGQAFARREDALQAAGLEE